jgi:hypothetical protein
LLSEFSGFNVVSLDADDDEEVDVLGEAGGDWGIDEFDI